MSGTIHTKLSVLKIVDVPKPGSSHLELDTTVPVHITLKIEATDQKAAELAFDEVTALIDKLKARSST